ncbi:MAG: hypothetical protein K2K01_03060, partial [Eubacterium sp.]|nr:hypothetical protein [Eubacterium sp.]
MKSFKNIRFSMKYDLSFLIKPLMLLSVISAVTYALKFVGITQADKILIVCLVILIIPIVLNHIRNVNYKLSFVLILFIFIVLYLNVYDDLLVYLANKAKNNGVIFGVMNSIFNTFGLTDFQELIYHTSYGGAKLINGNIATGAVDIYMLKPNCDESSMYLCGRYLSVFSALGIAFSVKKHKKEMLFITLFSLLTGNLTVYLLTLLLLSTPHYFI